MDFPASVVSSLALATVLSLIAWRSHESFRLIPKIRRKPAEIQPPDCMVVIPAKNEEKVIVRAIKSLPQDTVIVVDDASFDLTAGVAQAAGAGVLKAPRVSGSTNGKSVACAEGARVLTSKWILFTDADTWFEEDFLESAVAAAEESKVDFLSIYLRPEYETWAERVLGPLAWMLYFFGQAKRVKAADAFNGQCILVRRASYEFVGGHAALRRDLNDDLSMAALALRHRMRIAIARAQHLGHVQMRIDGFARQGYRFTQVSFWIGARILLGVLCYALWIPAIAWLIADRHFVMAALLFLWLPVPLQRVYGGMHRTLVAPIGIYWFLGLVLACLWRIATGRPAEWKGRVI